ncbi:MAG TPA: hypothetical protein VNB49_16960 [Candidatus Dormibacteraeota bacterium]|nr:hypothetical protein [Candidatus Dormibacteraeota bacterium]
MPRTARFDVNHMTGTMPLGHRFTGNFFWHLKHDIDWHALSEGQICCKVYASRRKIQGLGSALWRGRLQNADPERDFEAESIGKASLCSIHGNDVPENKGAKNQGWMLGRTPY